MNLGDLEDGNTPIRRTSRERKFNSKFVGADIDEGYIKLMGRIGLTSTKKIEKIEKPKENNAGHESQHILDGGLTLSVPLEQIAVTSIKPIEIKNKKNKLISADENTSSPDRSSTDLIKKRKLKQDEVNTESDEVEMKLAKMLNVEPIPTRTMENNDEELKEPAEKKFKVKECMDTIEESKLEKDVVDNNSMLKANQTAKILVSEPNKINFPGKKMKILSIKFPAGMPGSPSPATIPVLSLKQQGPLSFKIIKSPPKIYINSKCSSSDEEDNVPLKKLLVSDKPNNKKKETMKLKEESSKKVKKNLPKDSAFTKKIKKAMELKKNKLGMKNLKKLDAPGKPLKKLKAESKSSKKLNAPGKPLKKLIADNKKALKKLNAPGKPLKKSNVDNEPLKNLVKISKKEKAMKVETVKISKKEKAMKVEDNDSKISKKEKAVKVEDNDSKISKKEKALKVEDNDSKEKIKTKKIKTVENSLKKRKLGESDLKLKGTKKCKLRMKFPVKKSIQSQLANIVVSVDGKSQDYACVVVDEKMLTPKPSFEVKVKPSKVEQPNSESKYTILKEGSLPGISHGLVLENVPEIKSEKQKLNRKEDMKKPAVSLIKKFKKKKMAIKTSDSSDDEPLVRVSKNLKKKTKKMKVEANKNVDKSSTEEEDSDKKGSSSANRTVVKANLLISSDENDSSSLNKSKNDSVANIIKLHKKFEEKEEKLTEELQSHPKSKKKHSIEKPDKDNSKLKKKNSHKLNNNEKLLSTESSKRKEDTHPDYNRNEIKRKSDAHDNNKHKESPKSKILSSPIPKKENINISFVEPKNTFESSPLNISLKKEKSVLGDALSETDSQGLKVKKEETYKAIASTPISKERKLSKDLERSTGKDRHFSKDQDRRLARDSRLSSSSSIKDEMIETTTSPLKEYLKSPSIKDTAKKLSDCFTSPIKQESRKSLDEKSPREVKGKFDSMILFDEKEYRKIKKVEKQKIKQKKEKIRKEYERPKEHKESKHDRRDSKHDYRSKSESSRDSKSNHSRHESKSRHHSSDRREERKSRDHERHNKSSSSIKEEKSSKSKSPVLKEEKDSSLSIKEESRNNTHTNENSSKHSSDSRKSEVKEEIIVTSSPSRTDDNISKLSLVKKEANLVAGTSSPTLEISSKAALIKEESISSSSSSSSQREGKSSKSLLVKEEISSRSSSSSSSQKEYKSSKSSTVKEEKSSSSSSRNRENRSSKSDGVKEESGTGTRSSSSSSTSRKEYRDSKSTLIKQEKSVESRSPILKEGEKERKSSHIKKEKTSNERRANEKDSSLRTSNTLTVKDCKIETKLELYIEEENIVAKYFDDKSNIKTENVDKECNNEPKKEVQPTEKDESKSTYSTYELVESTKTENIVSTASESSPSPKDIKPGCYESVSSYVSEYSKEKFSYKSFINVKGENSEDPSVLVENSSEKLNLSSIDGTLECKDKENEADPEILPKENSKPSMDDVKLVQPEIQEENTSTGISPQVNHISLPIEVELTKENSKPSMDDVKLVQPEIQEENTGISPQVNHISLPIEVELPKEENKSASLSVDNDNKSSLTSQIEFDIEKSKQKTIDMDISIESEAKSAQKEDTITEKSNSDVVNKEENVIEIKNNSLETCEDEVFENESMKPESPLEEFSVLSSPPKIEQVEKKDPISEEEREAKNRKVVEERMKSFKLLDQNLYLVDRIKDKKRSKEVRRMVCDCFLSKEEIADGDLGCGDDCINRLLMIECGSRCSLKERCTNKNFHDKKYADVEVFNADEKGCGIRARSDISPGTFLMEYIGEVFDTREFKRRRREYSKGGSAHFYFMALRSDRLIDATRKGNISRFINHSCSPNAETQKWTVNGDVRIGFFANRYIESGEEVNFDYRLERYGREPQKCYCGTPECRGWLGESPDEKTKEEKEEERKKELKDKKKQEELRDDYLDEEIEELCSHGLRNKQDTLNLSRLMVRATNCESRIKLLKLILSAEETSRKLFLDYHGLKLLWSWMVDISTEKKTLILKSQILNTLKVLPITNKTQLMDSRVLNLVERWSKKPTAEAIKDFEQSKNDNQSEKKSSDSDSDSESKDSNGNSSSGPSPSDTVSPDDSSLDSNSNKGGQSSDAAKQESPKEEESNLVKEEEESLTLSSISDIATNLLDIWADLKEAFKIPKKERIELMKIHERELDSQYKSYVDSRNKSDDRMRSFYSRGSHISDRDKKERAWERRRERERRRKELDTIEDDGLSKEERRERFAQQVAKEEEENRHKKMWMDIWNLHLQRCSMLGHDPSYTPVFDPSGQYYWDQNSGGWQAYVGIQTSLPVPATYGTDQMPLPGAFYSLPQAHCFTPTGEEMQNVTPGGEYSYNLADGMADPSSAPPGQTTIQLPPRWKLARDDEGFIYFYHTKTRYVQWDIPSEDMHARLMNQFGLDDESESESDLSSSSDSEMFSEESSDESDEPEEIIQTSDEGGEKMIKRARGKRKRSSKLVQERIISPILHEDREAARKERREQKEKARLEAKKEKRIKLNTFTNEDDDDDDFEPVSPKYVKRTKELKMPSKEKSKERLNTAMSDKSDGAKRKKQHFKDQMKTHIQIALHSYIDSDCMQARIESDDDFEFLAKKLTHHVLVKELKVVPSVSSLRCNDSAKNKVKGFVKAYMMKFGETFVRDPYDTKDYDRI